MRLKGWTTSFEEQSADTWRQALEINPSYVKAIIKLGLALIESGEREAALPIMQRALDAQPQDVELHYQLGLMFSDSQQFGLAIEQFEDALAEDPRNIDIHANIALALQNMGLLDRAAAGWEALCEMAPETETGRAMLDRAERIRRFDDAGH